MRTSTSVQCAETCDPQGVADDSAGSQPRDPASTQCGLPVSVVYPAMICFWRGMPWSGAIGRCPSQEGADLRAVTLRSQIASCPLRQAGSSAVVQLHGDARPCADGGAQQELANAADDNVAHLAIGTGRTQDFKVNRLSGSTVWRARVYSGVPVCR